MARPPGTTFLGSCATTVTALLGSEPEPYEIILDSGSDITLISEKALTAMTKPPKIKQGQKIHLSQVSGNLTINQYVPLPIVFMTDSGPVELTVEAYIVKGMKIPLLIGNDFATQYKLSIMCDGNNTYIIFGTSERSLLAKESSSSPRTDDAGNVFHVSADSSSKSNSGRREQKRKLKKLRQFPKVIPEGTSPVFLAHSIKLKPESILKVEVNVEFPKDQECGFC
jgi:hypothetical protein